MTAPMGIEILICGVCRGRIAPGAAFTAPSQEEAIDGAMVACGPCHEAWRDLLVRALREMAPAGRVFIEAMILAARGFCAARAAPGIEVKSDPAVPPGCVVVTQGGKPVGLITGVGEQPSAPVPCRRCSGTGRMLVDYKGMAHTDRCEDCNGTGDGR